ncbi:hypothetical protein NHX12_034244 [Muraenolepis orangiensis]|uniref:Uncharacterized protein n=2 Tax=Muraenolepis orangiensis TaxID=630683 RepID=A0A9Q0D8L7_9TELE|nr:hypothetical protein NHX12_034244 [Muraenolepis orangiensis]
MEVEREAHLNIKILKTDHNKNSVNSIKKAPKGLKKARPLKSRRNTDDLNYTCKVLGTGSTSQCLLLRGIAMPVHNQQVSLHALQPLPQDHQLMLGPLGPLLHTLLEL